MPAARKRKSDAATSAGKSKKARAVDPHAKAIALVNAILSDPDEYEIPEDEDVIRDSLVELAQYARDLEGQVASGSTAAPQKTKEQIEAEVEKLRRAANAGIRKQMGVSCVDISYYVVDNHTLFSGSQVVKPDLRNGPMTESALIPLSLGHSWGSMDLRPGRRRSFLATISKTFLVRLVHQSGMSYLGLVRDVLNLVTPHLLHQI